MNMHPHFLVLLVILGIAGTLDWHDQQIDQDRYCRMVAAHQWPAFDEAIRCDQ